MSNFGSWPTKGNSIQIKKKKKNREKLHYQQFCRYIIEEIKHSPSWPKSIDNISAHLISIFLAYTYFLMTSTRRNRNCSQRWVWLEACYLVFSSLVSLLDWAVTILVFSFPNIRVVLS